MIFRSRLRTPLVCATLLLTVASAAPAWADGVAPATATPEQKKQATDKFTVGKEAFEAKNWEKAVTELRASLDIVNSPNARLELARALKESGALGDAWTEYGRVIDDATQLAASEARYSKTADAATAERTEVESRITFVTVTVLHAAEGTVLKVGGRTVPADKWTAPVIATPGAIDVILTDPAGKELARATVNGQAGSQVSATVDANPPPPPAPPPPPMADDKPDFNTSPPPPTTSPGRPGLRPYAYIAGGIGVAGLAAFTIAGVVSSGDFNDLKNNCPGGRCPASKSGEINDGKTMQTIADIGLGVGIAGVAAGATLFILSVTGSHDTGAPTTGLVVGPGYLGLRGTL